MDKMANVCAPCDFAINGRGEEYDEVKVHPLQRALGQFVI